MKIKKNPNKTFNHVNIKAVCWNLLAGKPRAGIPDTGAMICACFGVGENSLKESIFYGNAKFVSDIGLQLKAGTNCGSCIPEIKTLFA